MSLIVENLCKTYNAKEGKILNDLCLTVEDGEMFFVLGPSGCGKSTFLRILAGLLGPDSGTITLNGQNLRLLPPEKRNMPMVFQNYALWPHLDVYENIAFALKLRKLSPDAIEKRIDQMLRLVKMEDFAHRKISSLSGGQQQRIALARALAVEPSVLLMDEPLSNLDAKLRDEMRFEIRRICKERKLTVIYVTHDRKEAMSMADKVAVFEHGKISQCGSPRDIYLRPQNAFVASFLGEANFVNATCIGEDSVSAVFQNQTGQWRAAKPDFPLEKGREYMLVFRPEHVLFNQPNVQANRFKCKVLSASFCGEYTVYEGAFSDVDSNVFIKDFSGVEHPVGSNCEVSMSPDRVTVLKD